MRSRNVFVAGLGAVLVAGVAAAQAIPNWPAPATWTPTRGMVASAMADLSNPMPFIPIDPCRVADTRGNGFTGEWGPPIMSANQFRDFTIGGQCGIPTGATAVSFNFTVVGMGAGFLRLFPAGGAVPVVSTLNWNAFETKGNAAVVPLGTSSKITVNTAASSAHVIIDVNGYYSDTPASGGPLRLFSNSGLFALEGVNSSTTCSAICGVGGFSYSTQPLSYAVGGILFSTATDSAGTYGGDSTRVSPASQGYWSAGVRGEGQNGVVGLTSTYGGYGVVGKYIGASENNSGILGRTGFGVEGYTDSTSTGAAGVYGVSVGSTTKTYGVFGVASNTANDAAGVFGTDAHGALTYSPLAQSSGIRGEGVNGVTGVSDTGYGVLGCKIAVGPTLEAFGVLGYTSAGTHYGVYAFGDSGASGTKYFVEPHPSDAGKVIRYISLEGPEAGTYFRGRGRFEGRMATIEVPESFRMVSDEEGLSIQVTPIGDLASVAVVSIDLERVELKSSRDVEFFFTVNGVRKAFKNFQPIAEGDEFIPRSPDETIPGYLTQEARRRLIANGTYHEDGTVNMDTAERLGWAQQWRDRAAVLKAETQAAAAKRAAERATDPKTQRP